VEEETKLMILLANGLEVDNSFLFNKRYVLNVEVVLLLRRKFEFLLHKIVN